jgi:MHS family proline/betaine transporter-like MFS transporter
MQQDDAKTISQEDVLSPVPTFLTHRSPSESEIELDQVDQAFPIKPLVFGALAAAFEWYDYALFGYFATIIGTQFFPNMDASDSILSIFLVFATGFLMRPMGAILFGYVGDRVGRKYALGASLILMALPTALLGLLPTYERIGVWAPVLLVVFRMLQGLAVGGNYGGSYIFTIENAPLSKKGFAGSLASFGTLGGLLLGSGAVTLLSNLLSQEDLHQFGWRIPFILGSLSGLVGIAIRRFVKEDTVVAQKSNLKQTPIQQIFKNHLADVIKAMTIIMLDGVGIYILFVFMTTYASSFLSMPLESVLFINTVTMGILVGVIPIFGWLGDRMRMKTLQENPLQPVKGNPLLVGASCAFIFLSPPLYWWLIETQSTTALWCLQIVFAITMGAVYGAVPITISQSFPRNVRYTASGLSFNLSVALFGGTAPFIVTTLIKQTNILMIPAVIISLVGILSLIAVRKTTLR